MTGYPTNPNICDHGLNRIACLKCFHQQGALPAPKPDPLRNVPPHARSIIDAVKASPRAVSPAAIPAVLAAPAPGALQGVAEAQPVPQTARARGPQIGDEGAMGPSEGAPVPAPRTTEAYSSAQQPESHRYSADGIWQPPARRQVVEQLPTHPNPGFQRDPG